MTSKNRAIVTVKKPTASPFQKEMPSSRVRLSLSTLLMAMLVFAVMSATLLMASQLKLIHDEIHAWTGIVPASNFDGSDRRLQLGFLLVCYSTPLLLVAVLNLVFLASRTLSRSRADVKDDDEQWKME